jgi:hypothetical protein
MWIDKSLCQRPPCPLIRIDHLSGILFVEFGVANAKSVGQSQRFFGIEPHNTFAPCAALPTLCAAEPQPIPEPGLGNVRFEPPLWLLPQLLLHRAHGGACGEQCDQPSIHAYRHL